MAAPESTPVLRLAQIWENLDQARFSVLRPGEILNTTPEPTHTATCARLPTLRGNITFLAGR
jgi:subfamily B ATP-binding cassette protein HlyB/CyaB